MDRKNQITWQKHYDRERSILSYPDENLVRLLAKGGQKFSLRTQKKALDLGCGSGRHIPLLTRHGFEVAGLDLAGLSFLIPKFGSGHRKKNFSQKAYPFFIQGSAAYLPFKPKTFDAVVAWGSLHYGSFNDSVNIIDEVFRVLKANGVFWGTLRSIRDTYLPRGKKIGKSQWEILDGDIKGAVVTYFTKQNLPLLFKSFSSFKFGFIERTPLGEPEKRISHIFFEAWK